MNIIPLNGHIVSRRITNRLKEDIYQVNILHSKDFTNILCIPPIKMSAPSSKEVAIIGSGLSGLTLALALQQNNIQCRVYESRPAPLNIGGAVMLSPNALKILKALNVYDRLRHKGYNFDNLEYRTAGDGKLVEIQEFGSEEKYGTRYPITFGKKFSHITSETDKQVEWEFTDGTTGTAPLLIGADGIHSTVRRYLYPDLETKFTGMVGITAAVPTSQLQLPEGYHIPVTIMSPKGAFVIAPQQEDGSEVLIGKQLRIEEKDRAGWNDLSSNKEESVKFLQSNNDLFPEIVHNAVSKISHDKINVWPFYIVPKLDNWVSENRRVVILGDAAHAIPPSAGQGINQAFEDVYIFALLLAKSDKGDTQNALSFWQEYRQKRVGKVLELNQQIDLRRLPGNSADQKREPFELSWLYSADFEADVQEWVDQQGRH
ncbi:kynurenine 3-monooxygenase [Botrytis cinerea]